MVLLVILLIIIGLIVLIFYANAKNNKKLKENVIKLGAKDAFSASQIEGLGIPTNTFCSLYLFEEKILIDATTSKFEIGLGKLRAAEVKHERELIEKSKSVVGRAVIGTLLVPGLGTIVGGMSGIGNKKKKGKSNSYLILNYEGSNGELQAVTFRNNLNFIKMQQFCNAINQSAVTVRPDVVQL